MHFSGCCHFMACSSADNVRGSAPGTWHPPELNFQGLPSLSRVLSVRLCSARILLAGWRRSFSIGSLPRCLIFLTCSCIIGSRPGRGSLRGQGSLGGLVGQFKSGRDARAGSLSRRTLPRLQIHALLAWGAR
jgi:hypothetical protein